MIVTYNRHAESLNITTDWQEKKDRLQNKYAQLTDDDLLFEPGLEVALLRRVETKLKKERDAVVNIIRNT